MASVLATGSIEGLINFGANGSILPVPFANRMGEVSLEFKGELTFAETYSGAGVVGRSNACLVSEEANLMTKSKDFTWAMLQAAVAQRDQAPTASSTRKVQRTITVPVVTPAGPASYTLPEVPLVGAPFFIYDQAGNTITGYTVAGAVISAIPATAQGTELTISYEVAHDVNARAIYVGGASSARLSEASIYGRFRVCGSEGAKFGELMFIAPRAVIKPNLTLSVSKGNEGEAGLEFNLLRGNLDGVTGVYFGLFKAPTFAV